MQGRNYDFPNGKTSLLCFVKEDCPTCQLSLPLIEIIQKTFSSVVEVLLIGQDHAGNISMIETHQLATSLLNDDALKVSIDFR